ncbi:MAG: elongation factor G [Bacteroidota bacterium]
MKVYQTKDIRNVAFLGHATSGKTTLVESMLFEAGVINRRGTVEEQNTVSDHYNVEKEKGNSIFSSLMYAPWKESKINIIDTPGNDNFIGEVISALKVADLAVLMINGHAGVEVSTDTAWEYAEINNTPLIMAVNHMDHEKVNFDQSVEQAKGRFGDKVTVVQYPLNPGVGFNAIVDVLKMVVYKFPEGGGKPEKMPIPDSESDKANELHEKLVETVAEYDEDLMEAYFEKGSLDEAEMAKGLKLALLNRQIFPLFCISAKENMGSGRVMGFIHDNAPIPSDRIAKLDDGTEIACDANGKPVVFVYKTFSEPHLGEISYYKVYSGKIKNGDDLYNTTSDKAERLSGLFILNGKERTAVDEIVAGDIGIAVKLKATKSNHTMATKDNQVKIEPISYPEPNIRAAISAPNKRDMEKIQSSLIQIAKEDPTLLIDQSRELKQTILSGQGELHLNIVKYRLEKVYNLEVEYIEPRIPYRETITKMSETVYRHKKQSGGSGQFAEVHLRVEPYFEGMPEPANLTVRKTQDLELEWGGKLSFYWCIVGGSIDAKYINAIIKGIMNMLENGPLTGSYVRDVRVCVYDGKMHPVDSNDMAFQLAAQQAFKAAFKNCGPVIMEPIYDVEVLTPDDVMGDIMGDLQTRNSIIMGMDADGHYQKVKAKVPLRELYKYSSALRSLSAGRARHTRRFAEYSQVARDVQDNLVKAHSEEEVEA